MEAICNGNSEDLEYIAADKTVADCDCCDSYCTGTDANCNPTSDTVMKFPYNFISRTSYSFSENFKLADVDSPEN
jgi:hypothetical protein